MEKLSIRISDLSVKRRKEKYPKGANSPTFITVYTCPCGRGKVVESNTVGFDDHFVTLACRACLKKYHPFVDIVGYDFEFYVKD